MDVSSQHAKARRLVATIEYQLQQMEEAGGGVGGDESRHALAENVNALHSEVTTLERVVGEQYSTGVGASSQKAQLWRKRLAQLQDESMSLRRTVERFLRASYATSKVAQERQQLLGGGSSSEGGLAVVSEGREGGRWSTRTSACAHVSTRTSACTHVCTRTSACTHVCARTGTCARGHVLAHMTLGRLLPYSLTPTTDFPSPPRCRAPSLSQ